LKNNSAEDFKGEDSEDDIYDKELKAGQLIDYQDKISQKWMKAKIIIDLRDMIKIEKLETKET
jgi:hypothetical protein